MSPGAFGKNHATILRILKENGPLHRTGLRIKIKELNKKQSGLGMSMKSEVDVMKDLQEQDGGKMIKSRKEGRGKGRVYSITQNGERALLEWEGKVALSKKFSYDLGFKKFGVADARISLPSQCYLTYADFLEDAVIELVEELCNEVLKSWDRHFTDQPVNVTLEVKLNSEAIDADVLRFRKKLLEIQDRVEFLCKGWHKEIEESELGFMFVGFDRSEPYNLFRGAFETIICEKELKKRGIQLTVNNYLKMKNLTLEDYLKTKKKLSIDFCFSINGKILDLKTNPKYLKECLLGKKFGYLHSLEDDAVYPDKCSDCPKFYYCPEGKMPKIKGRWTILDEMEQPKIKRWISRYRKNLDGWFPYIPWNDLGFPSELIPKPSALPKDLFIPMTEQTCDANIRMLLHFLARLPANKAVDSWNFYFQESSTIDEFDDYTFLMTYHLVKRELKYLEMPEDIRTLVFTMGTTEFVETGPITYQTPFGGEMPLEKTWVLKPGSISKNSQDEVDIFLNQEIPSKAKKLKIFELFDTIFHRWEHAGKPIRHSRQIFRLLKLFLEGYKRLTEENNFKPEDALDWVVHLNEIKVEAENITF